MTEKPLPGWALPDKDGNVDYPVGPLMKWGAEMQVHIGAETGDLTACGMPGARKIQKLRVGQMVCPGCRFQRGPITEVLRGRIMESGLTVDEFARRVVLRGPRTVYGWLSGRSPIPSVVAAWLRSPVPNWPIQSLACGGLSPGGPVGP